jgi:curved DNA-binding protein CbpA
LRTSASETIYSTISHPSTTTVTVNITNTVMDEDRTYYDILELSPDASSLDIKKAYRRLALQHHPDRNGGSLESTERFKEIGQAYDCLSDAVKKYDYDANLRREQQQRMYNATNRFANATSSSNHHSQQWPSSPTPTQNFHGGSRVSPILRPYHAGRSQFSDYDAFAQFDRNFSHDPFFQEAFRGIDEEFARRFQPPQQSTTHNGGLERSEDRWQQQMRPAAKSKEGWIPWLLRQCGVEFQMTSYVSNGSGGLTMTQYSSSNKSTYQQKQSSVYRDGQGRQVRIQSMEQNGNQIEDTYLDNRLIKRKVNGVVESIERLPVGG